MKQILIVEDEGGKITVSVEQREMYVKLVSEVGKGLTFSVFLPCR